MRKHGRQVTDTEFCSTALNDETHALDGLVDVASWPRLCENAKAINRDRTTYSFKIALEPIVMAFNFEDPEQNCSA